MSEYRQHGGEDSGARSGLRLGGPSPGQEAGRAIGGGIVQGPLFECRCTRSPKGKVMEKIEVGALGRKHFTYAYDQAGHLTEVQMDGGLAEYYEYDESGRRIRDFRSWASDRRSLTYDWDGTLLKVEAFRRARPELSPALCELSWTKKGQLAAIIRDGRKDAFFYGADSRLDRALLAQGTEIRYHYENNLLPVTITANGALVAQCQWQDKLRLLRYRDCLNGLLYEFFYGESRVPVQVTLSGTQDALYRACGLYAQQVTLNIRADQVDSIREISLPDGKAVKCIEYDSFGNVMVDSRPEWKFPLGFACGLHDHWTGFVRFGFRDYDPRVGRFTARDPIGDTGGDHDLWDYCVDDPVSMNDPSGLFAPLFLYGAGMLLAGGMGFGVPYGIARAIDSFNRKNDPKKPSAVDAMHTVAPYVAGTMAAGAAPGALALGGPPAAKAYTHAGQWAGAALQASAHGDKIIKGATHAAQFAEPFLVPGPPVAPSAPGTIGAMINWGVKEYKDSKR